MNSGVIDIFDLLIAPIFIILILFYTYYLKTKYVQTQPHYKFLLPAVICKIIGAIGICLVYNFYYAGGDPINYFLTAKAYVNIFLNNGPAAYIESINYYKNDIYFNPYFNSENGLFCFHHDDYYALFVSVISTPFVLLGCKSFIASTILLSSLTFIGTWKLYELFLYHFPNKRKEFAFAILFVPSVFFWGSGILKDTYTFCFMGLVTYSIFMFFILKKRNLKYLFLILFCSFLIIMIKPYILAALMPGALIWLSFERINKIKNNVIRIITIPIIISTLFIGMIGAFTFFGDYLGDYSINKVLHKAAATQQDLIRANYGTNNFDIGAFEPTLGNVLQKAPIAIFSALFRPFLWDSKNPVMFISALESSFILFLSIYILFRIRPKILIKIILKDPLLIFCLLFSLFFAFSLGLTTANFGALVRLRIPCMPFYICMLLIILFHNQAYKSNQLK